MKTLQFYKISALVLLVLNVALVGFLFFMPPKPPHPKENDFMSETIETLQLNEKQAEKFEKLAIQHNQDVEKVQLNQIEWTREYFELNKNENQADSLLRLIKEGEATKIIITKDHLDDIKDILTSMQLIDYEEFRKKALDKILLKNEPKPKR